MEGPGQKPGVRSVVRSSMRGGSDADAEVGGDAWRKTFGRVAVWGFAQALTASLLRARVPIPYPEQPQHYDCVFGSADKSSLVGQIYNLVLVHPHVSTSP